MIGTHAVLQIQCPVCFGVFMVNDQLAMKVVEIGAASISPGGPAVGVFVEYLHNRCTGGENIR